MAQVSKEVSRAVSNLARQILAAARNWTLYPPEHPAIGASLDRVKKALRAAVADGGVAIGVTPTTLLVDGTPIEAREGPIHDAAVLMHDRDILRVRFSGEVSAPGIRALLTLLAIEPSALRARGGPAVVWGESGDPSIAIEQIDYRQVLEEREVEKPKERRDDLWRSIVKSIVTKQKTLDEAAQQRLLEIAGDPEAIGDLAIDVMAPNCTPDGSPMLTTQAAAVLSAYRHLTSIVTVMAPERAEEVRRNLAEATARLDPRIVMQIIRTGQESNDADESALVRGIAEGFDDVKVAQLLATALALEGQASGRLAEVFDTIAPDDDRKQRVLSLTRTLLQESDFGKLDQFQTIWQSMEELLLTYNEKPFVSTEYRAALDGVGTRADGLAATELPPEAGEWIETLGQENVRHLSIILLIDLLNLEKDLARVADLANDVESLAEDMLLAGDFQAAFDLAQALARRAADAQAVGREACRLALDELSASAALREAVTFLDEMDDKTFGLFRTLSEAIGVAAAEALTAALLFEAPTRARVRASELILSYGPAVVRRLAPLVDHPMWFVQRNAAELMGRLGTAEAVPLLQPLLRGRDPRVLREAVRALASIDDPAAARAVHTVLRAATGEARRGVVDALVAARDARVVPVLVRILTESDPLGNDHVIVLETLGALGRVGNDQAVGPVAAILRRRRWFARRKTRALREAAVGTLRQIGSPPASRALDDAARTGDRMLRKIARTALAG